MSKASEAELAKLHAEVARGLTKILQDGVEVPTKEGTINMPAPAAYFGVAVAMLKNNNITADPEKNEELKELNEKLQARRQSKRSELNFRDAAEDFATKHLGGDVLMN